MSTTQLHNTYLSTTPNIISRSLHSLQSPQTPTDSWRRHLHTPQTTSNLTLAEKWTTGIVSIGDFLLISSGARDNNLFVVDARDAKVPAAIVSAFSCPERIYNVSGGDGVVVAGGIGRVQLFSVKEDELPNKGRGVDHLVEIEVGDGRVRAVGVVNGRVMAGLAKRIGVWDVEGKVVCDVAVSDTVTSGGWSGSGNLVGYGDESGGVGVFDIRIAGGGKGGGAVWRVADAHTHSTSAVKFSPFIPYWVATSGGEGAVKAWDLRYSRYPTCRIDGHFAGVEDICWSKSRIDVLCTGSTDRTVKIWSLGGGESVGSDEPGFIGCSRANEGDDGAIVGARCVGGSDGGFTSPVVGVCEGTRGFWGLGSMGEVGMVGVRKDVWEKIATHKYPLSSLEHDVETAVQLRDLDSAYKALATYSKKSRGVTIVAENEAEIIELVTPKPEIPVNWTFGKSGGGRSSGREMIDKFRADLTRFTYTLPPGFVGFHVGRAAQDEFEMVLMRFNVLVDVAKGSCDTVLSNEGRIVKGLETDPTCIDASALLLMTEAVIMKDFLKGLALGVRFAEIIEVRDTLHMCLFPTIFESIEWLPDIDVNKLALKSRSSVLKIEKLGIWISQRRDRDLKSLRSVGVQGASGSEKWSSVVNMKGLESVLSDRVAVLGMARVELQIQRFLVKTPTDDDIVNKLYSDTKTKDFTISAHTNYILQDALLTCGKFDEYFANAIELCQVSGNGTPFSRLVVRHVEVFGVAKIGQYIDGVYHKASQKIVTAIAAGQQLALPPPGQPGADAANSVLTESLVSSIRCFRDGFVTVVKAAVTLATLEMSDSDHYASLTRIFEVFATFLGKLDVSLSELLKMVEGVNGKLQTVIQLTKNAVLNIKDGILDAMKLWPKNVKTCGNPDRIKALVPLQDEISKIGEKLSAFVIKIGMEPHPGAAIPIDHRRGGIQYE